MTRHLNAVTTVTALGCGLVAGAFFAFSSFVMQGLDELTPAQSVAAMNAINDKAVTPLFMIAIFGTAALCLALAVWAVRSRDDPRARWVLAGSVVYLLGVVIVTSAANVPLNDTLEEVRPRSAAAPHEWHHYYDHWIAWNHVRTVTSLAAAALLTVAVRVRGREPSIAA